MNKFRKALSGFLALAIIALPFGSCQTSTTKADTAKRVDHEVRQVVPTNVVAQMDNSFNNEDKDFDVSDATASTGTATLTGLQPNTTYYVRIYAVDSTGNYANSGYSIVKSATTAQKLTAPTPTLTVVSDEEIDVSITSIANATSYVVELSNNSSFTSPIVHTITETSTKFVGLTGGTTYYVRAKALYPDQAVYTNSNYSATASMATPTKVATPTLSVTSYDLTTISVSVGTVANAGSYVVEASTDSSFGISMAYTLTGSTNTLTGFNQGTTYYLRVRAMPATASYYRSDYSTVITQTTLEKLADPVLSFIPLSTTSINVSLPVHEGIEKTTVEYSAGAEFTDYLTFDIPGDTGSADLTGLSGGTVYYFRAKSYSSNSARYVDSEVSRIVFCETADTLTIPTFEAEATSDTAITVSIDNIPAAGKYEIEVTPDGGSPYTILSTKLVNSIPNLTSNTSYAIRIRALSNSNKFMDSEFSAVQNVTTLTKLPTPASVTTSLSTPTAIDTTVASVIGTSNYVTEIATDASFADKVSYTGGTLHTFSALDPGTTYYIRAKAVAMDSLHVDSDYTPVYTVTTPADLDAPLVTATATAQDKITVSVSAITGASSYTIEVADNSYFNSPRLITTGELSNVVTGLEEGVTYYVRARASYSDVAGAYSNYSSVVTVKTFYRLDAPVITVEPISPTEISVITGATNPGGYDIEISENSSFTSPETVHTSTMRTSISGLTTNTLYYVRAKALATTTGTVNSDYSSVVTVTTPLKLSAPTLSSVSLGVDVLQVTINPVSYATTYRLEVADNVTFLSPDVTITSDLVNTITGLAEDGTYFIRAKALASSNLYADSDYGDFITNSTSSKLAAPTVSANFTSTTSISVTASSAHADRYQIEISKSSTFSPADTTTKTTTVNAFTGLEEGTTYYVRVKALSDDVTQYVNSEYSDTVRVTTPATLTAPIITLVPLSTSSFSVQAVSANASGYSVEVSQNDTFTPSNTYSALGEITGCTPGTTYYVRVKAIGDGTRYVDSGYSVTDNVTTLIQLNQPTISATSLGTSDVSVGITSQTNVNNYRIEVSEDYSFTAPTVILTNNLTTTVSGLTEDTNYYVRVKANTGNAAYTDSDYCTPVTVRTSKKLPAPTVSAEFASTTSIIVNASSANASSYRIELSLDPEFSSPRVFTETTTVNTYDSLNEGLTYYVRAKALTSDNSVYTDSDYSPTVMVTTPRTLAVPVLAVNAIDHLSFSVSAMTTNASSYIIEVATNSSFTDSETFTEPGIISNRQPGTTYYVRAKAVGGTIHYVDSDFTDASTITTLTKLNTPVVTATVLSNTEIRVDFDAVDNAEDYRVEVADNTDFRNAITVISNRTSSIVPGLAEGTTWYARVRAITSDVNYVNSDYSENATAYTPVQLATPTFAAGSIDNTDFYVNIEEVSNADRYIIEVSTNHDFSTTERFETTELDNVIPDRVQGTTYFVRVTALSDDHTRFVDSYTSRILTLFTHTKLVKPVVTVDYLDPTYATVHIDPVQYTSTFDIEIDTDEEFSNPEVIRTTDLDNLIVDRVPGTTYYFRAKAITEDSGVFVDSDYSRTEHLLMPIQLDKPTFTVSSYTDTTINLSIDPVENAGKYRVDYSTDETFAEFDTITSDTADVTIGGLTAVTTYYIRVMAITPSRVYVNSELSAPIEQTTRYKITAPLILTEVGSDSEISVFASVVDYADGYSIEYATDSEFTDVQVKTINSTDVLLSELQADTVYYIRARAFDSAQEHVTSDYSNMQMAKTLSEPLAVAKFDAPIMVRGYADSASQVTFLWTAGTQAPAGFELEIAKDSTFTEKVYSKNISSGYSYYALGDLDPSTTYYARIRTIGVQGRGETSNWSNVISTTTEDAPAPKLSVAKIIQLDTSTDTSTSLTAVPHIKLLTDINNPTVELQVSKYADFNEIAATATVDAGSDYSVLAAVDYADDYFEEHPDWSVLAETDGIEDALTKSITISGLEPGEMYYVRAKILARDGVYEDSDYYYAEQLLQTKKLTKVPELSLTMGTDRLIVRVGDSEANGWAYEAATDSNFENVFSYGTISADELYAIVEGLTPETTYYVRAKMNAQDSEHVDSSWVAVSGTTFSDATLPATSGLSFGVSDVGSNSATLTLTSVGDRGAKVELATDSEFKTIVATRLVTNSSSLIVDTLKPETTYYARAKNFGDGNYIQDSEWFTSTSFTTKALPKADDAPTVAVVAKGTTISLSWAPSDKNISGYDVQYSANTDFSGSYSTTVDKNTTTYTASGLKSNTMYYLRVRSKGVAEITNDSDWSTVTATTELPILPKVGQAEIGNVSTTGNSLTITWDPLPGADNGYEVEYASNPDYDNSKQIITMERRATLIDLTPDTLYYIRIRALGVDGVSEDGDWVEITKRTPIKSKFNTPLISGQVMDPSTILVMWSSVESAIAYTVDVDTNNMFLSATSKVVAENGVALTGLSEGTTYFVRVRVNATDTIEASEWSDTYAATTTVTPKFTNIGITKNEVNGTVADIEWSQGQSRVYEVQYTDANNFNGEYTSATLSNKETLRLSNLPENTTYKIRVRVKATSTQEASDWTEATFTTTTIASNPDQLQLIPVILTSNVATDETITVQWTDSNTELCSGYIIAIRGGDIGSIQYTTTAQEFAFKNLKPSSTYTIDIRAKGVPGSSLTSDAVSTTISTVAATQLEAPSGVQTVAASESATISWVDNDNVMYYQVQITDDVNFEKNIDTVVNNKKVSEITVYDLEPETTYYFRLKALNSKTSSAYTIGSFTTKPVISPLTFASLIPGTETCLVEWDKLEGASGYSLEIATDKDFIDSKALLNNEEVYSKFIGGLKQGTTYYIRLSTPGQLPLVESFTTLGEISKTEDTSDDENKDDTTATTTTNTNPVVASPYNSVPIEDTTTTSTSQVYDSYSPEGGIQYLDDPNIDTTKESESTSDTLNKDVDGDGKPDLNIDLDGDGKPDLNIDTNGDGRPDLNVDTDGDGKPDLNIDTDGDGVPDLNIDTNGDGKPDENIDVDGDGKPDLNIRSKWFKYLLNIDIDGDGKPDLNIDLDGDGRPDLNIDTDDDGIPDAHLDRNHNNIEDSLEGYDSSNNDAGFLEENTFSATYTKGLTYQIKSKDARSLVYRVESGDIYVSADGLVTFNGAGDAKVAVFDVDTKETSYITFSIAKATPSINIPLEKDGVITVNVGDKFLLFEKVAFSGNAKVAVYDNTVIQAQADGYATALKPGSTTIRFTFPATEDYEEFTKDISIEVIGTIVEINSYSPGAANADIQPVDNQQTTNNNKQQSADDNNYPYIEDDVTLDDNTSYPSNGSSLASADNNPITGVTIPVVEAGLIFALILVTRRRKK